MNKTCPHCSKPFTGASSAKFCSHACSFSAKVVKGGNDECWGWSGSKHKNGYGTFSFRGDFFRAHRVSYELSRGDIPEGMSVCHSCDNPTCVNPSHLWLGDQSDNMKDRSQKGRQPKGGTNGKSFLADADVYEILHQTNANRLSRTAIARAFGVSVNAISCIVTGKRWKHLPLEEGTL